VVAGSRQSPSVETGLGAVVEGEVREDDRANGQWCVRAALNRGRVSG
jgi:hypothetical protein